jgi:hypothetical protein
MDSPGITTTTTNTIDHIISSAAITTDINTAAAHSNSTSGSSSSSDLVAFLLIKAVFPSHQRYPAHDPPTFTLSGTLNGTPFDSSVLELLKKAGEEASHFRCKLQQLEQLDFLNLNISSVVECSVLYATSAHCAWYSKLDQSDTEQ